MVPGLCLRDSSTHLNCELFLWLARKLVKVFGGDWLAKQAFFFLTALFSLLPQGAFSLLLVHWCWPSPLFFFLIFLFSHMEGMFCPKCIVWNREGKLLQTQMSVHYACLTLSACTAHWLLTSQEIPTTSYEQISVTMPQSKMGWKIQEYIHRPSQHLESVRLVLVQFPAVHPWDRKINKCVLSKTALSNMNSKPLFSVSCFDGYLRILKRTMVDALLAQYSSVLTSRFRFIWQLSFLCQQLCNTKGLQKAPCPAWIIIFIFIFFLIERTFQCKNPCCVFLVVFWLSCPFIFFYLQFPTAHTTIFAKKKGKIA